VLSLQPFCRYELIVSAGCPFAARPWAAVEYLGLQKAIRVVRAFPGNGVDGFFFRYYDYYNYYCHYYYKNYYYYYYFYYC
jgi:glutathionyl-hydroquinone reductase